MPKGKKNYLDFVPEHDPQNTWDQDADGIVTVHLAHRGLCAAVAHRLFRTPCVSHILLDEYGSFLWKEMDGQKTIGDLAAAMGRRFGEKAEPLYDRLVRYMEILRDNHFVRFGEKPFSSPA